MNKTIIIFCALAAIASAACSEERTKMPWEDDLNNKVPPQETETPEAKVGEPLPLWTDGCLDIHFINSGRGECAFYILPDGTTLLVDAGEIVVTDGTGVPQKPDASTRPYIVDAKYIRHFLPQGSSAVDWCAPSHFHIDHIGSIDAAAETSPNGYRLTGLMALYGEVPFSRVLDRGYPNYGDDPDIPEMDGQTSGDWVAFVKWAVANKGMKADRFRAGEEQITLLKDKDKYPDFRIFNIIANGYAWNLDSATGQGTLVNANAGKGNPGLLRVPPQLREVRLHRLRRPHLGTAEPDGLLLPRFHLQRRSRSVQGAPPPEQQRLGQPDAELRILAPGNHQPELLQKAAGHPPADRHRQRQLRHPPLQLDQGYFQHQRTPGVAGRECGALQERRRYNGHIVVRVGPGRSEYYVYMLDDTDFDYKVTSIHGPYSSK